MGKGAVQYAALPWRRGEGGEVEILLITTRTTGRWIIPKGWPMDGREPYEAAAQEAWEEAGIRGKIGAQAIGAYAYDKLKKDGRTKRLQVDVFPLEVTDEASAWPESGERQRRWFAQAEAAAIAGEPQLQPLLKGFAP